MTRLICCTSAKGGVGKTTIVSNLAAALTDFGENTIAIDANLTTPNLGLHTGMHLAPRTLHDVLRGYYPLKFAIYPHPYGFKIIPASLKLSDIADVDIGRLPEITFSLLGKADYILIDSAAGLGREALSALSAADEVLLVTNPTLTAVTDALKILKIAQNTHIKIIGTVVNRVKNTDYELSGKEIEEILGMPIIARIPEDPSVERSLKQKKLLYEFSPYSPAAIEIKKLAAYLTGKKYEPPEFNASFWKKFFSWLKS
ncbi:MAG: cell division ATPase MinD [Candidatus Aenigmatarchaeota archaeon]|nr:cell division ATPase MinD [Candidatus Aenigmarchaeota archaeon]